ncbi:MAG: LamG domain-containing protein [Ignavibacteriae bacterium]|nr:LamG domain-containing protein [Ignavibacteriota bacterium]
MYLVINKFHKSIFIFIIISILLSGGCEEEIYNSIVEPKNYLEYGNVVKSGLIAYYPFNADALDYSENKMHGIVKGVSSSIGRFGQPDGSLKFDGNDDFVEIPGFKYTSKNSGTLCFWLRKILEIKEYDESSIISNTDTTGKGYVISIHGFNSFWFEIKDQYFQSGGIWRTNQIPREEYIFLAITFSDGTITKYSDGYPVEEIIYTPDDYIKFNNNQSLYIGKSLFSSRYKYFEGEIDDLLIYDRALNEEEVLQLYNWE